MTETAREQHTYPWSTRLGDVEVTFRKMTPADRAAVLAFTRSLPERDLLFLRWDITSPEVIDAWIRNIERGRTITLLALEGEKVIGYCSLHHSRILWTRHLGEMRVFVGPAFRGKGLGGELAQQVFAIARELELLKVVVQMMSTQRSAQNIFHHLGFIPEALLHDWVIDRNGRTHDLIVLSREVDDDDLAAALPDDDRAATIAAAPEGLNPS